MPTADRRRALAHVWGVSRRKTASLRGGREVDDPPAKMDESAGLIALHKFLPAAAS